MLHRMAHFMWSMPGAAHRLYDVHVVGSGDDGVGDGRWGARIETVWAGLGEVKTRQCQRCKLDIIDIVGIMLNGVKAFRILRRECFPSSGDGFKVRRAGCVTEGLTHRNEQE